MIERVLNVNILYIKVKNMLVTPTNKQPVSPAGLRVASWRGLLA